MNKCLSAFGFLFLFTLSYCSVAQTVHYIFFGDTYDPEVGNPAKVSNTYYDRLSDQIVKYAEFQAVKKHSFSGDNFTLTALNEVLNTLVAGEKDVILFYISAHGWNDGTNEYPMIVMESGAKATAQNSINLSQIYERLMAKKARLTLVLGEACNALRTERPQAGPARTATHPPIDANPQHFRELFRRSQLGILSCSSRRGQISISDREEGGRFTQAFFSAIEEFTASKFMGTPTWEKLMSDARIKTRKISLELSHQEQDPYFEIQTLTTGIAEEETPVELSKNISGPIKKDNSKTTKRPIHTNPPVVEEIKAPVEGALKMKPMPEPTSKAKSTTPAPCFNVTAFETVRSYHRFVEGYWKSIERTDIEDAREIFSNQVYTEDQKEFYQNLPTKLNIEQFPEETQRLQEYGNRVVEILEETDEQLSSPNYRMKASSKLAMVITDLKKIIQEIEGIKRSCLER